MRRLLRQLVAFAVVLAAATTPAPLSTPLIRPGCIDDLYEIKYGSDLRSDSRSSLRFAHLRFPDRDGSWSSLSREGSMSTRSSSSGLSSAAFLDEGPADSQVFRAVRRGKDREVIVKRIAIRQKDVALLEAETMAVLADVPATMRLYDVVEDGAHIYLVMQLFDGKTVGQYLTDLVERPETTCGEVVAVLERIAGVVARTLLAFLEHGFVHTDLNVLNVMIDADDNVVVLDMGSVRTFFDSCNPTRNGFQIRPSPETYEQAQTRHFRRFLFNLFPMAAARFAVELQQWPLYNQVMDPLCPPPKLAAVAGPAAIDGLRGANAARRYDTNLQSVKLSALLADDCIRPVLDHERARAAERFRVWVWAQRQLRTRSCRAGG